MNGQKYLRKYSCTYCLQLYLAFGIMAGAGLTPNTDHRTLIAGLGRCRSGRFVLVSGGR